MKQIITTSLTHIFVMLAGAVHAGDCMRLCDNTFWQWDGVPSLEDIQAEIDKGADPKGSNARGITPLHYAALDGTPELIRFLLEQGANIEAKTAEIQSGIGNRTHLHFAVYRDRPKNVAALVDEEAFIDVKDTSQTTPLSLAVEKQNFASVNVLLELKADTQARDKWGKIPFDYARTNMDWLKYLSTYRRLKDASQGR